MAFDGLSLANRRESSGRAGGRCRPQVEGGVEQCGGGAGSGEHGLERLARGAHLGRCRLDHRLRLAAAHPAGERRGGGIGEDEAVGHGEVGAHAPAVDREALGQAPGLTQCAGGKPEERGQGVPLRLPQAGGALLAGGGGVQQRDDEARCGGVGGEDHGGGERVLLVRHGRRAAAALGRRLAHLADLGRGEEHHVGRHAGERCDQRRQPRADLDHAGAVGVPGDRRDAELQFPGEAGAHRRRCRAKAGERADRAAERGDQSSFAERRQFGRHLGDAGEPRPGDSAEGDRRGVLAVGAPDARRARVLPRQRGEAVDDRNQVGGDQAEGVRHLQNQRRVDDVLAGGALVDMGAQLVRQQRLDRLDEGNGDDAGVARARAQRRDVEVVGLDPGQRRCQTLGHQAGGTFGAGQRRLGGQHGSQPRAVGKHRAHGIAGKERAGQPGIEGGKRHRAGPALRRGYFTP